MFVPDGFQRNWKKQEPPFHDCWRFIVSIVEFIVQREASQMKKKKPTKRKQNPAITAD